MLSVKTKVEGIASPQCPTCGNENPIIEVIEIGEVETSTNTTFSDSQKIRLQSAYDQWSLQEPRVQHIQRLTPEAYSVMQSAVDTGKSATSICAWYGDRATMPIQYVENTFKKLHNAKVNMHRH